MENPSLRVSGHVSSMNGTFIVEDYVEDDFGQWATDEVTGEQSYIDDERSCFGHVMTLSVPGSRKHSRAAKLLLSSLVLLLFRLLFSIFLCLLSLSLSVPVSVRCCV